MSRATGRETGKNTGKNTGKTARKNTVKTAGRCAWRLPRLARVLGALLLAPLLPTPLLLAPLFPAPRLLAPLLPTPLSRALLSSTLFPTALLSTALFSTALLLALFSTALPGGARAANPELNAVASLLVPGLGQTVNGDYGAGALQFGSAVVLATNYLRLTEDDRFIKFDDRIDEQNKLIRTNRTTFEADFYASAFTNLSLYSSFSAYRDARLALNNEGYETPAPSESLGELALAPFNPEYLFRPTTLIALVFPLLFAVTEPDDDRFLFQPDNTISRDELRVGYAGVHEMVAVGEESFFRGVLNNGFSNSLGEGWGLATSSLVFGLAHSGNPGQANELGATLFGVYTGYLQQINDYRIGQGVAIHFWWNFLVTLGMLNEREPNQIVRLGAFYTRF